MPRESSMADRREYVRVSVSLPMNPKLGLIDDPATSWLYVVSLCHCGEYLTDGFFIPGMVARAAGVPSDLGKKLVSAGMWHEPGHECPRCPQPVEGHMVIHDYLLHQRSRSQADQARAAGKAGASARWSKRDADRMRIASGPESGSHTDPDNRRSEDCAATTAPATASDVAMRSASEPQCDPDATPNAEVEGEVEGELPVSPSVGGSGGEASQRAAPPRRTRSDRGTRITADWAPSIAKRNSLRARFDRPHEWWLAETAAMINHFTAKPGKDGRKTDWDATFDNWVKEAIRREGGQIPRANGSGKQPRESMDDVVARNAIRHKQMKAREEAAKNGAAVLPIGEPL